MTISRDQVKSIARLARIRLNDDEIDVYNAELNKIMQWIEQLNAVDTTTAEPYCYRGDQVMHERDDVVTDGAQAQKVLANAPETNFNMFAVNKVVE